MNRLPTAGCIAFLLIAACASPRRFLVQDPPRAAAFDSMIEQAALEPRQNIRQLLLHQGENMSIHLVRIRDREPPHFHTRYDLFILLIEGKGTLWLQRKPLEMKAGDVAAVSKGTRHYFVNEGSEPATALVVFAPAYDRSDREVVEGVEE